MMPGFPEDFDESAAFRASVAAILRWLAFAAVVGFILAGLASITGCAGLPQDAQGSLEIAALVARANHGDLVRTDCAAMTCAQIAEQQDRIATLLEETAARMRDEHGVSSWLRGVWDGLSE